MDYKTKILSDLVRMLFKDRLGKSNPSTWMFKTSEFGVLNGINLIELYTYILENHQELPTDFLAELESRRDSLQHFYN